MFSDYSSSDSYSGRADGRWCVHARVGELVTFSINFSGTETEGGREMSCDGYFVIIGSLAMFVNSLYFAESILKLEYLFSSPILSLCLSFSMYITLSREYIEFSQMINSHVCIHFF